MGTRTDGNGIQTPKRLRELADRLEITAKHLWEEWYSGTAKDLRDTASFLRALAEEGEKGEDQ
jgi:hypothetical protein